MINMQFKKVKVWAKYSCPNCDLIFSIENLEGNRAPKWCPFCQLELEEPSRVVFKNCFEKKSF